MESSDSRPSRCDLVPASITVKISVSFQHFPLRFCPMTLLSMCLSFTLISILPNKRHYIQVCSWTGKISATRVLKIRICEVLWCEPTYLDGCLLLRCAGHNGRQQGFVARLQNCRRNTTRSNQLIHNRNATNVSSFAATSVCQQEMGGRCEHQVGAGTEGDVGGEIHGIASVHRQISPVHCIHTIYQHISN